MKTALIFIIVCIATLAAYSCSKDINCDNARLCMVNKTTDTILYCWGCNLYRDTLFPGGKACYDAGPISVSRGLGGSSESIVWVDFNSTKGSYRIKVDDCNIELPLE